jgi:hypothetical protein
MTKEALEQGLEEAVGRLGVRDVRIDPNLVSSYCSLTGHDYEYYRGRNRIPTGYLMTLTAPVVSELFVSLYSAFSRHIQGIIHTRSRVEIVRPLTFEPSLYHETIRVSALQEKKGKMGRYLVADLEITVRGTDGLPSAVDLHQFFLRVRE